MEHNIIQNAKLREDEKMLDIYIKVDDVKQFTDIFYFIRTNDLIIYYWDQGDFPFDKVFYFILSLSDIQFEEAEKNKRILDNYDKDIESLLKDLNLI